MANCFFFLKALLYNWTTLLIIITRRRDNINNGRSQIFKINLPNLNYRDGKLPSFSHDMKIFPSKSLLKVEKKWRENNLLYGFLWCAWKNSTFPCESTWNTQNTVLGKKKEQLKNGIIFFLESRRNSSRKCIEKKTEKIYWNLLSPLEIRWGWKERVR